VRNGESADQVRATGDLGTRPLVVITADRPDAAPYAALADPVARHDMLWADLRRTLHGRLVRLSARSAHVWARGSGHMVPRDEPEVIVEAVRQVVEAVRARGGS
jgi:pimeloyl-ACP methyl ester carboxylesterase